MYLWRNSLSAIHNHPFCGLFTVLEGESVHAVYEFAERERVGPRLLLGEVRPIGLDATAAERRLVEERRIRRQAKSA